jgi:hypothetical protein
VPDWLSLNAAFQPDFNGIYYALKNSSIFIVLVKENISLKVVFVLKPSSVINLGS